MTSKPPLQLILLRHKLDQDERQFEEAVRRAFEGGIAIGGYLASGEDLGVEFRQFDQAPTLQGSVDELIDAASHTILVAIPGDAFCLESGLMEFLESCWLYIRRSSGKHRILLLTSDERRAKHIRDKRPLLGPIQAISAEHLGERVIRPALFALRTLHEARLVLASVVAPKEIGVNGAPGFLRLFISHAKLDGLPLAQALKHQIDQLPWLRSFYDARDLLGETDWENALEVAAMSSLLIILRTDAYEQRPWCQKEALWAEETAAPTVLVEARPGLAYPAGILPLERMPSVRIPDGNLLRILYAALRESLRHLLFQRRILEMQTLGLIPLSPSIRVFSYPPGMTTLIRACQELLSHGSGASLIVYPDPPLRRGQYEAASALVASIAPNVKLVTPETLAAGPAGK
jgi:hypothetical protein